jgi:hypothetical protein
MRAATAASASIVLAGVVVTTVVIEVVGNILVGLVVTGDVVGAVVGDVVGGVVVGVVVGFSVVCGSVVTTSWQAVSNIKNVAIINANNKAFLSMFPTFSPTRG